MNENMNQANFLVLHGSDLQTVDMLDLFERFKQIFKSKDTAILQCGGRGGKIINYQEKKMVMLVEEKKVETIELYGGVNDFDYQGGAAENWGFMIYFSKKSRTLLVGQAIPKEVRSDIFSWSIEIMRQLNHTELFDYGYSYSNSIPYGVGYALGIYQSDSYHEEINFDESEKIGNWRRARSWRTDEKYLRDVFSVNIISKEKYINANIDEVKKSIAHSSMEDHGAYFVWRVESNQLRGIRLNLIADCKLISDHHSDTFSQIPESAIS